MARSARAITVVLAAGLAVSACSTTMDEAAREQLNSARIRVSQVPTRVTTNGHLARVERLATVVTGTQTAYVVTVQNVSGRQLSDLPISVGYRHGRRRLYANLLAPQEFSYFDSHLPVIPRGAAVTWVYTSAHRLPRGSHPFAAIGGVPAPAAPVAPAVPVVRVRLLPGTTAGAGTRVTRARLAVENLSAIPQLQLQVYAYARHGGRYLAAGNLTVPTLGGGAATTVSVPLAGRASRDQLQVQAIPTIVK